MRSCVRVGVGVLGIGLVVGLGWWAAAGARLHPLPPHGVLSCPSEIDLGPVELHRPTEAVLTLTNTGGGPLTVTGVTSDCGCMGVRVLPDHREVLTTTVLTVPPGGELRLEFPVRATGVHGATVTHHLRFRTDDPARPEVDVRLGYRPVARYFTDPNRVVLGDAPPGEPAATIGLYTTDASDCPRVREVVADHPDRLRVTLIPDSPADSPVPAEGLPATRRFAQVRVEVVGPAAGETLDTAVRVFLEARDTTFHIPVSVRTPVPVEITPPVVYLPRSSSSGPVWSASVQCRVAGPGPFEVQHGPLPDGLTVRVEETPGNPAAKCIVVDADPAKLSAATSVAVPLRVSRAGHEHQLSLRVAVDVAR